MPRSRSRSHRRDHHSRRSSRELSRHSHRVSYDDRRHYRSRSPSPVDRRHESRHLGRSRSPHRRTPRAVSPPEHRRSQRPPAHFSAAHVRSVVSRRRSRSSSLSDSRSAYGSQSERGTATVPSAGDEVIDRSLANVHVWQAMFEMLSVKDRIRLEMTNKRLGILMFTCWKRVTSLDTKCLTWMSDNPSTRRNRENLWAPFVTICVNRIGDGLRSLTIREVFPMDCSTDNLRSIGQGCPNVETVNFVFDYGGRTLDIRFDSFSHLKTLTVSTERDYIMTASPSIFLSIPVSIEVIRGLNGGWEEPFENAAQMEGFFAHRASLREICLDNLCTRHRSKADIFRVVAERCPHLKSIILSCDDHFIDYSGVIALESMKELRIPHASIDEMEIVTICERSPLVEALEFDLGFSSNIDLQSAALNALGALTKLAELTLSSPDYWESADVVASSLVAEFVRGLARNSGASLRRLHLDYKMPLPTAAINALANGCPKLRYVRFYVRVGEATPTSIRFLIDCIVAHPSWIPQTGERTLLIIINVIYEGGDEAESGRAAFTALAGPAANLPTGVELDIRTYDD